jgi:tetratricopeptide (TPR) repeat protein
MKTKPSLRIIARFSTFMLTLVVGQAQITSPLDEAASAIKSRDLTKAASLLEPLTGAGSTDAAAFHLMSQVKSGEKNTKAAVEMAEKATRLDATKSAHFAQLGMALGQRMGELGFMQQAMLSGKLKGAFEKAVELDPNDVSGLIGLTRYYSNAPAIAGGSTEKAKELAQRVQRLDPFLGELELAQVEIVDENFAEALRHFEAAAHIKPKHAYVQTQCGRMLAKLGRKEEARARYEAALAISANFEPATKGLTELEAAGR